MEVMEVALKKYLDKFELYVLRNILTVPENIEQLEKEEKEREGALAAVDGGDMIPMDVALNKGSLLPLFLLLFSFPSLLLFLLPFHSFIVLG